jgi:predicted acylesterase/phospholipase RssA
VIEKLAEAGWLPQQPDDDSPESGETALVGTSIGSMNAALYATGGVDKVVNFWENVRTKDMNRLFRLRPWRSVLDRSAWEQTLKVYLKEDELAQVTHPLFVVTTNIKTAHPRVYTNSEHHDHNKTDLYKKVPAIKHKHLLASSAIPYLYPPITIDEKPHWDGAVMYNSPLQPAIHCDAEEVMIVLLSPYHDLLEPGKQLPSIPSNLVGKMGHLLDLALLATFENDFEQMRKVNRRVRDGKAGDGRSEVKAALIGPDKWLNVLDMVRYSKNGIKYLREKGYEAASKTLERIDPGVWDSQV